MRESAEKADNLRQCFNRQNNDIVHNRRFATVVIGDDDSGITGTFGGQRHGKRTFHRLNTTVQREFTQDKVIGDDLLGYDPGCGEYPQRDGQIETGSFLFNMRRSEIHRDSVIGEGIARIVNRRLDPFFAFFYRSLREPHRRKCGESGCNINFNFHQKRINSNNSAT